MLNREVIAIENAKKLWEEGERTKAISTLRDVIGMYPDGLATRLTLFDFYIDMHRWKDAYVALAPETQWNGYDDHLLRVSYASARLGRVYEGQREYVIKEIMSRSSGIQEDSES